MPPLGSTARQTQHQHTRHSLANTSPKPSSSSGRLEDLTAHGDDTPRVDLILLIQVDQIPRLAEAVDPERADTVAVHRAQPRQRRRMRILHRDERGGGGHSGEERLDVSRAGVYDAVLAEGRVVPLIVQEVRRAHLRSATAKGGGQLPQGFSAAFISAALLSLL